MPETPRAILLDEDKTFLALYEHFFNSHGYMMFTTDNPYKVLLYGREIKPEVIFMDAEIPQRNNWEFLNKINQEPWMQEIPIALLSEETLAKEEELGGISNICNKKDALNKIKEVLEGYCLGSQKHDCLVLADYSPTIHEELETLKKHRFNCFLTHDMRGSKKYLSKNKPLQIAIKYTAERYNTIAHHFADNKTFRIDSLSEIPHH